MSDIVGPELGLSDASKAALPDVPAGWSAYPSLGGGVGAKKFFPQKGAYEDVLTNDPDALNGLCEAVEAQYASTPPATDEFQEAVEAPVPAVPEAAPTVGGAADTEATPAS